MVKIILYFNELLNTEPISNFPHNIQSYLCLFKYYSKCQTFHIACILFYVKKKKTIDKGKMTFTFWNWFYVICTFFECMLDSNLKLYMDIIITINE